MNHISLIVVFAFSHNTVLFIWLCWSMLHVDWPLLLLQLIMLKKSLIVYLRWILKQERLDFNSSLRYIQWHHVAKVYCIFDLQNLVKNTCKVEDFTYTAARLPNNQDKNRSDTLLPRKRHKLCYHYILIIHCWYSWYC